MSVLLLLLLAGCLLCGADPEPALAWNLTVTTPAGRTLLSDVSGVASKGRLHAIMGPSGSGKSTLLNALAGVVPRGSLVLEGWVLREGDEPAYIEQEDLLFAQLTVAETMDTSAALRRPHEESSARSRSVEGSILKLGLRNSKATPVGDKKTRGLSGGEKKRLSIGDELVGLARQGGALLFADEPTSGLDSFQAERVAQILKALAEAGNTVVCSIHQPRASIVALFDDLTLLSEGRVMFSGEARQMGPYFASLGYPCPAHVSPAEHYVDLVSVDYSSPEREAASRATVRMLGDASLAVRSSGPTEEELRARLISTAPHAPEHRGLLARLGAGARKIGLLYTRAFRNMARDRSLNVARFMSSLFSALLFGAIYFRLGDGASTVPDRLGLLQVAAVNTAMLSLIKATTSFVTEKLIVQRERRNKAYSVLPYFLSKLVAEAPINALFPCLSSAVMYRLCGLNPAPGRFVRFLAILVAESFAASALGMSVGSLAPSVEAAIAVAPAVMVIFIVFGGLYVVNTPSYLSWVPGTSLIRWAYEALVVNEFQGLSLRPEAVTGPKAVTSGEQVLDSMGFAKASVRGALLAQGAIIAFNYIFTIVSLVLQRPSFEKVKPPRAPAASVNTSKSMPMVPPRPPTRV